MKIIIVLFTALLLASPSLADFDGKYKGTIFCEGDGPEKGRGEFAVLEKSSGDFTVFIGNELGVFSADVSRTSAVFTKKGVLSAVWHDAFVDDRGVLATLSIVAEIKKGKIKGTFTEANYFFDDCSTVGSFKGSQ